MRSAVTWLTDFSYRKAWLVIVAVVLVLGYGIYSMTRVNQELIPDIEFPLITVVAQAPGSQPDDVVRTVTAPIEAVTSTLPGLKSTETTSVAGLSVTVLNFEYGTDLEKAEQQIREQLAGARLPQTVTTDVITFDVTQLPVVTFAVQGDLSQSQLTQIAQTQIVPALSALDGVASIEVAGGTATEVVVALDHQKMLDAGLSYEQVAAALRANNVILPSGQLQTGDTVVPLQTVAVLTSLDAIRAIGIPSAGGSVVSLGSIATVTEAPAASTGINRTNGQPSVGISVLKTQDSNTVAVAHAVTDELAAIEGFLPDGVTVTAAFDQAEFITESISGVVEEGIIGGVLAIIVVFIFLGNWRSTLVTAVSIPLSIIAAVILLDRLGYSLNIMTLGGLTIAIGRVIDDSIVVLENIYRHMARGEKTYAAIVNGSREVTIAIVGATATTVAVFLPLGLTGGIIGQLFLSFSLAVVFALLASLVVAITVIPVLARFFLGGKVRVHEERRAADTRLGRIYQPLLRWALGHRWLTLGVAGALFVGSLALVPLLPVAFLPDSGEKIVTVSVAASPGETQASVLEQAIAVEGLLQNYDVERYETVITGASGDFGAVGNIISGKNPNSATITVTLAPGGMSKGAVADDLRERIAAEIPNSETVSVSAMGQGFGGGIDIALTADSAQSAAQLPEAAAQVEQAIRGLDGVANVTSDVAAAQQTLEVRPDPAKTAAAGLTPEAISASLASLSSARTVTVAQMADGARGVRLVVAGTDVNSVESLGALEVAPGVRLDSVATIVTTEKQVSMTRVDGKPAAGITAEITSENTGQVTADAQAAVDTLTLPAGIEVYQGGLAESLNEGFASMIIAILASIVLVYVIMALLFQSLLTPFVILFSLPLAMIGAIVALVVTGSPLSISAMIGILMLVGIVVTNAIVMLEFVIMLQHERGYSIREALIEGATTRLRPILMTAIAAMLALIPLSLGLTEGALIASDLGRVVIGGLFSSTLLTLFVVPVAYSFADGLRQRFSRRSRTAEVRGAEPVPVGD
ncbi:MAG: efflux RND transporter permease subunit [Dehalococcoidia bacterium]